MKCIKNSVKMKCIKEMFHSNFDLSTFYITHGQIQQFWRGGAVYFYMRKHVYPPPTYHHQVELYIVKYTQKNVYMII